MEDQLQPLDQARWQALTSWSSNAPTYGEAWALLTCPRLPPGFREVVRELRHPFLRKLQLGADATLVLASEPLMVGRSWNNRFANLVSGRFTELLFHRTYASDLARTGLQLTETTAEHDWFDYLLSHPVEHFTLAVNVKNAGVQFETAQLRVDLPSDDTLPIATYKIFGATAKEGHTPLIYVYLVDWGLLPRLRSCYWESLNEDERGVFQLMTSFRGLPRKLEDRFIECTVGDRLSALLAGVGYDESSLGQLPFRAISGRRCQRIFYTNHRRAPYVYVQRMNTDPNVHVSVRSETVHFASFIERWLSDSVRRQELLTGLNRTQPFPIPDPPL